MLRESFRVVLLGIAGLISVLVSALAALIVLWAIDLEHPKPGDLSTTALLFLVPIVSPLIFATAFVSQRWHRRLMRLLACASIAGVSCEWGKLRVDPFTLALVAIAGLVEASYWLQRQPIKVLPSQEGV
jgi:hypothetical protein